MPIEPRRFSRIGDVRLEDPATWEGRVFLTFDIDWAHDDVVNDTIDLVEQAGVRATWFITHRSPVLDRLRSNPAFELGIHPNFLPLLMQGSAAQGETAAEVLDRLLEIVPEAKSVRTHSLVQSGRLLELYASRGMVFEASVHIPESGMTLRPWRDWFGVVRVPYGWEDDFWCDAGRPASAASEDGITGFDFHPIHVYLNTDALARYESARATFADPAGLRRHRAEGAGVRSKLLELLGLPGER